MLRYEREILLSNRNLEILFLGMLVHATAPGKLLVARKSEILRDEEFEDESYYSSEMMVYNLRHFLIHVAPLSKCHSCSRRGTKVQGRKSQALRHLEGHRGVSKSTNPRNQTVQEI